MKPLRPTYHEKSQVQALERTQPGLPLGIGHIQTKSHDYMRHGTATLFAALDYLQGKLISSIERQHRHQEWLAFLKKINKETPRHLQLHLIVDNYATHKHAAVKAWLVKHPRFHIHFTPTSSSWMNMVERFFRDITVYLRDGSFASERQLESSITTFMALRNAQPTRYVPLPGHIRNRLRRTPAACFKTAYFRYCSIPQESIRSNRTVNTAWVGVARSSR